MKNNKILKGAGVLLIVAAMVLSSIAVTADTNNEAATCLTKGGATYNVVENKPITYSRDLLWDNGLPDERNGVSCVLWPSNPLDREIIDDFEVTADGWSVCDGHFRIVTYGGAGPDIIDAVRVFFYKSTGPCEPDPVRFAERDTTFNAYLTGDTYFDRPEIAIDCEFDCVNLTPGEWWVCFQPEMDDNSFWLTTGGNDCSIFLSYPDQSHPKWTKGYPTVFDEEYDVSFQLTGEVIGEEPVPDLDCDGDLNWVDVSPGTTVTGDFVVMNIGDPSSLLNWEITDWPTWGNWTFTPLDGTGLKPGDGPFTVQVEVVAPEEQNQDFSGTVKIVNKDDTTDTCRISVSLATPRSHQVNNFPLLQRILELFPNAFPILRNMLGM